MSRIGVWSVAAILAVALGTGACSQSDFELPVIYPVAQNAKTVALGDLDNDGRDDVALTAWMSGLFVFYQQPDGTLGSPTQLYAPNMPTGIAVGDISGDGLADLAVGGSGGVILLYYQQSDGTLGLPETASGYGVVNSLVIADLNGDGLADIADTSATYPLVLVCYQEAAGVFGLPVAYSTGGANSRSIRTLDYNSDGMRDIAVLLNNQVCCLTGVSDGFAAPAYIPAEWAHSLAAGDITGDGMEDLVFTVYANQPYAALGIIPQNLAGLAASATLFPTLDNPQPLAVADVNADGLKDVLAAHAGYYAVTANYQNPGGTLGSWVSYAAPYCSSYEPGAVAVGDLNSDGLPDLALADEWNGLVVFLHTPGEPVPEMDTLPPVCSATASGTTGTNGWYVSDVTVTITAEDNPGGSGVSGIIYTSDGVQWFAYTEPVRVSTQGRARIGYRADDNAGNTSETGWLDIRIDTQPPDLVLDCPVDTLWPPNGAVIEVPVGVSAVDSVSGIAALRLSVTDEYGLVEPYWDVVSGAAVPVPLVASREAVDADGRLYTLTLAGVDAAGNSASVSVSITVPRASPPKRSGPKQD